MLAIDLIFFGCADVCNSVPDLGGGSRSDPRASGILLPRAWVVQEFARCPDGGTAAARRAELVHSLDAINREIAIMRRIAQATGLAREKGDSLLTTVEYDSRTGNRGGIWSIVLTTRHWWS